MKLKLHRESVVGTESAERVEQGGSLRFPVRAVRAMPAPGGGWKHERAYNTGESNRKAAAGGDGAIGFRDVILGIEATLDRMQSQVNELQEQVQNFKFPGVGSAETDRPRAA